MRRSWLPAIRYRSVTGPLQVRYRSIHTIIEYYTKYYKFIVLIVSIVFRSEKYYVVFQSANIVLFALPATSENKLALILAFATYAETAHTYAETLSQIYLFSIPQRSVAHGFCRHVLFCSIMLLFITNLQKMLSISQTADAIIKRLTAKSKAYRDVYLIKKEVTESSVTVVLGASCIEMCRESLGRTLVKRIKALNYKCKPDRIGFAVDGRAYGTYCDPGEVLVAIIWNNAK